MTEGAKITNYLTKVVSEVISLRYGASLPPTFSGAQQVLDSLVDVRRRLDRVEELLVYTIQIKGRAHSENELKKSQADQHWAEALRQGKRSPVMRGNEYEGPRERYAEADLATLNERREARQSQDLEDFANSCLDVIRTAHRGLDGLRQDHLAVLRAAQMENALERP